MNQQQDAVPGEEVWQERIFVLAGHNFVHGVYDGFQTLKSLNAVNHRRLTSAVMIASKESGPEFAPWSQARVLGDDCTAEGARQTSGTYRGKKLTPTWPSDRP